MCLLSLLCVPGLTTLMAASAPAPARPSMSITGPAAGAAVSGPTAKIEVGVKNFTLVDANIAPSRRARKPTINKQNAGIN
jgi:hypothetical protein